LGVRALVWRVEHFGEIDSTNTYVVERVRTDDPPEGLVAVADYQSAGRGRLDRRWESPPGTALLCSLLLRPDLAPESLQLVVAVVALSVRAALVRLTGLRADLKWPNDLIVGDRKLAGLLAEIVESDGALAVIVGLGVNLTDAGPPDAGATSVRRETGLTVAPRALLDIVLEEVETRRDGLDSDEGRRALHQEYEAALATLGQTVRVTSPGEIVVGRATGVDASGRLLVEVDGASRVFDVGDVVRVRRDEA
jgi:BirA family biotin operon repressor/biotin-[acetyl-CoA-carboxylase] ligase